MVDSQVAIPPELEWSEIRIWKKAGCI